MVLRRESSVVKGRVHRTVVAIFQIAGLVLFSAAAPLAHLHHQDGRGQPDRREGYGGRPPHHRITFHAHLDGHPHRSPAQESGDPSGEGARQDDSLNVWHGRLDSPRGEWPSKPLLTLASPAGVARPSITSCLTLPAARFEAHRPPLLFRKPARAPPSIG